jgi:hypothetical protein
MHLILNGLDKASKSQVFIEVAEHAMGMVSRLADVKAERDRRNRAALSCFSCRTPRLSFFRIW